MAVNGRVANDRFAGLLQSLEGLARPSALDALGSKLAAKAEELLFKGFGESTDPYGRPWAPRSREYPWPLLMKSTDMLQGFHCHGDRHGVRLENDVPYMPFHQGGTKRMPARKMYPDEGSLGDWEDPLVDLVQDFVLGSLSGR